jgi:hypothetical protein
MHNARRTFDTISLFKLLKSQDEQLSIVLVREWPERKIEVSVKRA